MNNLILTIILTVCLAFIGCSSALDKSSRGLFPIYGNWCGPTHPKPGFRPPAINKLDALCKEHDDCYARNAYNYCACDNRLKEKIANEIFADTEEKYMSGLILIAMAKPCIDNQTIFHRDFWSSGWDDPYEFYFPGIGFSLPLFKIYPEKTIYNFIQLLIKPSKSVQREQAETENLPTGTTSNQVPDEHEYEDILKNSKAFSEDQEEMIENKKKLLMKKKLPPIFLTPHIDAGIINSD